MIKNILKIIAGVIAILLPPNILNPAEFMVFMAFFGMVFYAYLGISLFMEGLSEVVKKITGK